MPRLARSDAVATPRFGTIYYWALAVVFVSAAGMAVLRWTEDRHLFALGTISFGVASVGYLARKVRWRGWKSFHILGMSLSFRAVRRAQDHRAGRALPGGDAGPDPRGLGGVAIHEFYGCTEAAPSCGGYTCGHAPHFMEDTHLVETVDPETLEPTPPGAPGLVVITNLCSEASPQVRFVVGDITVLSTEPCPCGRTHVHCQGFAGRADDTLNVRGVTLFPSAVEDMLRRLPEVGDEFQIVLDRAERARERFRLIVEERPGTDHDVPVLRPPAGGDFAV